MKTTVRAEKLAADVGLQLEDLLLRLRGGGLDVAPDGDVAVGAALAALAASGLDSARLVASIVERNGQRPDGEIIHATISSAPTFARARSQPQPRLVHVESRAPSGPEGSRSPRKETQRGPRSCPPDSRPAPDDPEHPLHDKRVFVDGANIALAAKPGRRMATVDAVIRAAVRAGALLDDIDVVFDSSFRGRIRGTPEERLFLDGQRAGRWRQAPSGATADSVMLERLAMDPNGGAVVSNDTFRDAHPRTARAANERRVRVDISTRDVLLIFPCDAPSILEKISKPAPATQPQGGDDLDLSDDLDLRPN